MCLKPYVIGNSLLMHEHLIFVIRSGAKYKGFDLIYIFKMLMKNHDRCTKKQNNILGSFTLRLNLSDYFKLFKIKTKVLLRGVHT